MKNFKKYIPQNQQTGEFTFKQLEIAEQYK